MTADDRVEIRAALQLMQGVRCAYCEAPLGSNHHIEHFRRRRDFPQLTFRWANLFWSCSYPDCCGYHKDNGAGAYSPDDILDPSADQPDNFLVFASNGTIGIRPNIPVQDSERAAETLRIFNLDPYFGRLRQMRRQAVRTYLAGDPSIVEAIMSMDPEEGRIYARQEVEQTANDPFCTVIRHLFAGLV